MLSNMKLTGASTCLMPVALTSSGREAQQQHLQSSAHESSADLSILVTRIWCHVVHMLCSDDKTFGVLEDKVGAQIRPIRLSFAGILLHARILMATAFDCLGPHITNRSIITCLHEHVLTCGL